ncbi:hypothetical protein H9L01_01100 [Erysipelothrix inopinata]|uniref:Uncharacterized protein n=1 Tax=Erysipelothrix inopinata TaxID=225084 RepID=A0A7G9RZH4_9FIRM|nr:hypothetical protein [Erysipelothrix inopinata]QNN60999.1 hypothetical protein H9L01_01100 [Erysipelothrix inopinata]
MKAYHLTKLTEAIMKQKNLSPTDAHRIALEIYTHVNWDLNKKKYDTLAKEYFDNRA